MEAPRRNRKNTLFPRLLPVGTRAERCQPAPMSTILEDVIATDELTITLMRAPLHVGRISPAALKGCAWPLLKAMLGTDGTVAGEEEDYRPRGFFSLTQEEAELTLVMDDRCRAAFDEAAAVATVEYAPHKWCAFELHLGSLAWEVPGLVCHLATLMAESDISILNLSSHDRDFLLVQESDVSSAKQVIQQRLRRDAEGLKEAIVEKAITRRSGTFSSQTIHDRARAAAHTPSPRYHRKPSAPARARPCARLICSHPLARSSAARAPEAA